MGSMGEVRDSIWGQWGNRHRIWDLWGAEAQHMGSMGHSVWDLWGNLDTAYGIYRGLRHSIWGL